MNPRRLIPVALGVVVLGALAWFLFLRPTGARTLTGYVEGDPLYLAAPVAGAVAELHVREGGRVEAGAPTFRIDPAIQAAQAESAQAAVGAAEARAEDLARGQRPQELEVFDAELEAALAGQRQAEADYARIEPLVRQGIYAPARLDQVRAARDAARAQVAAVRRRRGVATLGAREDAIRQAREQVGQARGALRETQVRLDQLSPAAPITARVEEIFYQPGEWVPANQPVLSLLPDDRVRLVFFVPEAEMVRYRPGERVRFACDGCEEERTAVIRWVSPRPEFAPPVLYARGARDRLVYRVEATPENAGRLNPGLPVDVLPLGAAR